MPQKKVADSRFSVFNVNVEADSGNGETNTADNNVGDSLERRKKIINKMCPTFRLVVTGRFTHTIRSVVKMLVVS